MPPPEMFFERLYRRLRRGERAFSRDFDAVGKTCGNEFRSLVSFGEVGKGHLVRFQSFGSVLLQFAPHIFDDALRRALVGDGFELFFPLTGFVLILKARVNLPSNFSPIAFGRAFRLYFIGVELIHNVPKSFLKSFL